MHTQTVLKLQNHLSSVETDELSLLRISAWDGIRGFHRDLVAFREA